MRSALLPLLLFLVGSAGIGVGVWFGAPSPGTLERVRAVGDARADHIAVVLPRHDLPPGHRITHDDLVLMKIDPDYVPDTVVREPEEGVGRVTVDRVLAFELLRTERLRRR